MLEIKIRTENAAFDDGANGANECARILRKIAAHIEAGDYTSKAQTILDANGNDVGRFKFQDNAGK